MGEVRGKSRTEQRMSACIVVCDIRTSDVLKTNTRMIECYNMI